MLPALRKVARPLVLSSLVVSLFASCGRSERPDVVLILLDTLRPDYLGFYGHERETAPFLAELAGEATVFRRAYSVSSWTAPSTASLFTSWHPTRHGVVEGFFAHAGRVEAVDTAGRTVLPLRPLPGSPRTLPELFRDAGYRTYGLASNINIGDTLGFSRGFDLFELQDEAEAESLVARLEEWIGGEQPSFVYLHLNDVHKPHALHEEWYVPDSSEREGLAAVYRSEISYVDDVLERLFERHGWREDTIVAIVSDHGEGFGEHGHHGHNRGLFRELVQILALLRAPEQGVIAQEIDANVSILDIAPTLAELAGIDPIETWEGLSLADVARGQAPDSALLDRALVLHREGRNEKGSREVWSLVEGDWHLIEAPEQVRLYDLATDPLEAHDLAATHPEVTRELLARLDDFRRNAPRADETPGTEVELDETMLEQLEALGYVE